jgi:hypothetical protein
MTAERERTSACLPTFGYLTACAHQSPSIRPNAASKNQHGTQK